MEIKFCAMARIENDKNWEEDDRFDSYEEAENFIKKQCESPKDLLVKIEFKIEKVYIP